jgi:hypothetical protein
MSSWANAVRRSQAVGHMTLWHVYLHSKFAEAAGLLKKVALSGGHKADLDCPVQCWAPLEKPD